MCEGWGSIKERRRVAMCEGGAALKRGVGSHV